MSPYLEGPDGLRVEPVQLKAGSLHLLMAQIREPGAQPGEVWYRITRRGMALGVPGYYQLHELEEIVNLADLHAPEEGTATGTA
ncbi:hypothetical protein ACIBH1_08340 [Nonomuraea sp. NPDC050663]|uniref:Uncharacterized protein n=1 Tax=Nonomuraea soli TaxID=1032476 RepID=A0A7W0CEA6_9ACTN|nr:hypothetical protein [Nonomuraea soli]MBA2889549.1 hypothetical protein [Nonomuraea soli]NUT41612.1 hypothetical protein [Thermoactinospora sp.]